MQAQAAHKVRVYAAPYCCATFLGAGAASTRAAFLGTIHKETKTVAETLRNAHNVSVVRQMRSLLDPARRSATEGKRRVYSNPHRRDQER
jgi:hypothetical protein